MIRMMSVSQAGPSGPGRRSKNPGLKARLVAILFSLFVTSITASAQTSQPGILQNVGIDQKLGNQIPLDTSFRDENGAPINLRDCFHGRPVILTLVYYECPMLCNMTLNGMSAAFNGMNDTVGQQFDVIAVSFDPRETSEMAAAKKLTYLRSYRRPSAAANWHFLTGSQDSIHQLTQAAGFRYAWDEQSKTFAHASGIMLLTPQGKISKYFFGVEFEPLPLEQAIGSASANVVGEAQEQILYYCFQFDPATGRYGLIISRALQVGGALVFAALAGFISFNVIRERRRKVVQE